MPSTEPSRQAASLAAIHIKLRQPNVNQSQHSQSWSFLWPHCVAACESRQNKYSVAYATGASPAVIMTDNLCVCVPVQS